MKYMRNFQKLQIRNFSSGQLKQTNINGKKYFHKVSSVCALTCFTILTPSTLMAQHLKLILGEYNCTSNSQCAEDEYCDIDSHNCKSFVCPPCVANEELCKDTCDTLSSACPSCPECEECPECPDGWYRQDNKCIQCPDKLHFLNGKCVECLTYEDCTNATKPYCTSSNECEPCPDGTKWKENKCVPEYVVTIHDLSGNRQITVLKGETISQPAPELTNPSFDFWAKAPNGTAVSFPYKVTQNMDLYAYYNLSDTTPITENYNIYGANKSEVTAYSPEGSENMTYEFLLYRGDGCAGGWRGCGYGEVKYSLDGNDYTNITCYQEYYLYGKNISIYRSITGIRNSDGCTTGYVTYRPYKINYPY